MKNTDTELNGNEVFVAKLIGYVVGLLASGFILMWYNYILCRPVLEYWKLLVLSLAILAVSKIASKAVNIFFTLVLIVAILSQTMAWLNIITLPIFK